MPLRAGRKAQMGGFVMAVAPVVNIVVTTEIHGLRRCEKLITFFFRIPIWKRFAEILESCFYINNGNQRHDAHNIFTNAFLSYGIGSENHF